jgi:predicted secreted protein
MVKKLILVFYLFITFFPNDLCSGMGITKKLDDKTTIIIKKQDNGKEISIKCGDVIQIELAAMGAAGYDWHIDNLDMEHLALVSEETRAVSESQRGAPIIVIRRFKAKEKGSTEIKMDHYRVWEGKEKKTEYFSIKLTIE